MVKRKGRSVRIAIVLLTAALALFFSSQLYSTWPNSSAFREFEAGEIVCYAYKMPTSDDDNRIGDEPITTRVELYRKNLLGRLRYIGTNYTWQADEYGENGMPFWYYYRDKNNDAYMLVYYSLANPQEGYSIQLTSPYTDETITYQLTTTENGAYAITPRHEDYSWPPQLVTP